MLERWFAASPAVAEVAPDAVAIAPGGVGAAQPLNRAALAVEPTASAVMLDHARLDDIRDAMPADGDALVVRVIRRYLEQAPDLLTRMAAAASAGDTLVLGRIAHSLKSSSATVGATALAGHCRRVENAVREGNRLDWPREIDQAQATYAATVALLRAECERVAA